MLRMILALLAFGVFASEALQVFDCEDQGTKFVEVDLIAPESCPDPIRDFLEPTPINVQVVQTESDFQVTAYRCRATVTKKVCRCGSHSWNYGCETTVSEQQQRFSEEERS